MRSEFKARFPSTVFVPVRQSHQHGSPASLPSLPPLNVSGLQASLTWMLLVFPNPPAGALHKYHDTLGRDFPKPDSMANLTESLGYSGHPIQPLKSHHFT